MFGRLAIGLAVIIPFIYGMAFHLLALILILVAICLLLVAYVIGDKIVYEYYKWK